MSRQRGSTGHRGKEEIQSGLGSEIRHVNKDRFGDRFMSSVLSSFEVTGRCVRL